MLLVFTVKLFFKQLIFFYMWEELEANLEKSEVSKGTLSISREPNLSQGNLVYPKGTQSYYTQSRFILKCILFCSLCKHFNRMFNIFQMIFKIYKIVFKTILATKFGISLKNYWMPKQVLIEI